MSILITQPLKEPSAFSIYDFNPKWTLNKKPSAKRKSDQEKWFLRENYGPVLQLSEPLEQKLKITASEHINQQKDQWHVMPPCERKGS